MTPPAYPPMNYQPAATLHVRTGKAEAERLVETIRRAWWECGRAPTVQVVETSRDGRRGYEIRSNIVDGMAPR